MKEIWKDIKESEGFYEVSNLGGVRSLDRVVSRRNGSNMRLKGCVLKPCLNTCGYMQLNVIINGNRKAQRVHRLVAEAFIPNIENHKEVNHVDGDKTNNRIDNLEWCTRSHNIKHAHDNGLVPHVIGIGNGMSKLKESDIYTIRELKGKGESVGFIANHYDVALSTIYRVISRQTWAHMP